ncbi:MAG: Hpt domain-containing protein, partial [Candidatus Tectomicrobia bacterium]|nr:Hpt domain-containing protein [Candidatus Tectomicrobia bacterium]
DLIETMERLAPDVINPESKPPLEPPVTDLFDKTTTLHRVDGDRELLQEIVGLFGEECVQMMEAIHSAIRKQDALSLRQAAHTLKGEVSNFGAMAAVEAAMQLEMMGRDEKLADAEAVYTALEHALEHLLPALHAFAEGEVSEERKTS